MSEGNLHHVPLPQHILTSTGTHRLRCLADRLTSVAEASIAGLQQHHQQDMQQKRQHSFVLPTLGSETKSLIARLALSKRYHVRPHARNSFLNNTLPSEDFEIPDLSRRGDTDMLEVTAGWKCIEATTLQLVAAQLDSLERDSIEHSSGEARWARADVLLSSAEVAVSINCPASRQHSNPDRTVTTPICADSCASLGNTARLCLVRAHRLIEMLTTTSDTCVYYASTCRKLREAHMQRSAFQFRWFGKDRTSMSEALRDATFLAVHADFPPVYLGTPRPGMSYTDSSDLDADSSVDLLYLLLMLKCDSFYVHCTGPKHIIGECMYLSLLVVENKLKPCFAAQQHRLLC